MNETKMNFFLCVTLSLLAFTHAQADDKLFSIDKERAVEIAVSKISEKFGKGAIKNSHTTIIKHIFSNRIIKEEHLNVRVSVFVEKHKLPNGLTQESYDVYSVNLDDNGKVLSITDKDTMTTRYIDNK